MEMHTNNTPHANAYKWVTNILYYVRKPLSISINSSVSLILLHFCTHILSIAIHHKLLKYHIMLYYLHSFANYNAVYP